MKRRPKFFQLRLTEDEHTLWAQAAVRGGFDSVSALVRYAVNGVASSSNQSIGACKARVKKGAFCKKCGQTH